jgi:hypothetical protein
VLIHHQQKASCLLNPAMKIDPYTKILLTVIAVSLALIALRDVSVISTAHAQPSEQGGGIMKVQIVSIAESRPLPWQALPVTLKAPRKP